jgi:dTDP-4-dehydrorhamnose reductase
VKAALIFGADGQVGRALVAMAPQDVQITALRREACDLCKPEQIASAVEDVKPDLIFNAAAYTAVDRAEGDSALAHRVNSLAPGLIAQAARGVGARLVHLSTDFVFYGDASTPRKPYDVAAPRGVYASTKLEGERRVLEAAHDSLIVRTAWVYSAQGANFVNTMLRLMRERDSLSVIADQIGTPTYAPSLARALWTLAANGAQGVHHYTDAGVASWYDFAVAIEEEARLAGLLANPVQIMPIATVDYPTPAPRPAYSVLDKSGTWALLGGAAPHWRVNLRVNLLELKNG